MIITITGKPCSGKDTVTELFCKQYSFNRISTGAIFRSEALKRGFSSITNFQHPELTKEVDKAVDDALIEIGKTRFEEDLIITSRTAWHFIPNSFKVYLDVSWQEASKRLLEAERESEKVEDIIQAENALKKRYIDENARYKTIYNIDCTDMNNFNLVIDTSNKTAEETAKIIYNEYIKFLKKKND